MRTEPPYPSSHLLGARAPYNPIVGCGPKVRPNRLARARAYLFGGTDVWSSPVRH